MAGSQVAGTGREGFPRVFWSSRNTAASLRNRPGLYTEASCVCWGGAGVGWVGRLLGCGSRVGWGEEWVWVGKSDGWEVGGVGGVRSGV